MAKEVDLTDLESNYNKFTFSLFWVKDDKVEIIECIPEGETVGRLEGEQGIFLTNISTGIPLNISFVHDVEIQPFYSKFLVKRNKLYNIDLYQSMKENTWLMC